MIGVRRRHPWLHRASTEVLSLTNQQMLFRSAHGPKLLVALIRSAGRIHDVPAGLVILAGTENSRTALPCLRKVWAVLE